jgi:hypothetical protein
MADHLISESCVLHAAPNLRTEVIREAYKLMIIQMKPYNVNNVAKTIFFKGCPKLAVSSPHLNAPLKTKGLFWFSSFEHKFKP